MRLYNFGINYDYVIDKLEEYKKFKNISWDNLADEMNFSKEAVKSWRNKTRKLSLANLLIVIDYLRTDKKFNQYSLSIDECLYERREIIEEIDKYDYDLIEAMMNQGNEEGKKKLRELAWGDILYLIQKKLFFVLRPREERALSNYLSYYCCYSDKALKDFDIHNRIIEYEDFIKRIKEMMPNKFPMELSDEERLTILAKLEEYVILTSGEKEKYDYYDVYLEEE